MKKQETSIVHFQIDTDTRAKAAKQLLDTDFFRKLYCIRSQSQASIRTKHILKQYIYNRTKVKNASAKYIRKLRWNQFIFL